MIYPYIDLTDRNCCEMQQLKLIQTIDNLKLKTEVVVHRRMIERKLTTMALPKVWELTNGQLINVTTPATIRAGELGQVILSLCISAAVCQCVRLNAQNREVIG